MSWLLWAIVILFILFLVLLLSFTINKVLAVYFVYQPYKSYKMVSQRSYRKITVREGTADVDVDVPYLLSDEDHKVDLSIIVPCYNETKRFPETFRDTYKYLADLKQREGTVMEMVLVNDGSKDATWEMIKDYCAKYEHDDVVKIRGVSVSKNSGKGNAVRMGFLYSKGNNILMIDADGATAISDYERLHSRLNDISQPDQHGIAIGSRRVKGEGVQTKIERTFIRNFVSKSFNLLTRILIGLNVQDTQCGFKLFRKRSARIVITQHLERWSFDCELLYIAAQKNIPVIEVAVNWTEMPADSKISVVTDSLKMFRDILAIRMLYLTGLWSLKDELIR